MSTQTKTTPPAAPAAATMPSLSHRRDALSSLAPSAPPPGGSSPVRYSLDEINAWLESRDPIGIFYAMNKEVVMELFAGREAGPGSDPIPHFQVRFVPFAGPGNDLTPKPSDLQGSGYVNPLPFEMGVVSLWEHDYISFTEEDIEKYRLPVARPKTGAVDRDGKPIYPYKRVLDRMYEIITKQTQDGRGLEYAMTPRTFRLELRTRYREIFNAWIAMLEQRKAEEDLERNYRAGVDVFDEGVVDAL